ncbi:MAG: cobalt-precorrin-6A reductase [Proteobacteria bacterium]|nr:cobalt-precorrin-6A reductase [Pseudomonadota bacterium]
MAVKHLLILGGTAEARELARRVAITIAKKVRVTTSLAGRRAKAPALPGEVRIGGFGGVGGLVEYLRENAVDFVIDATHPFSAVISDHANAAATATGVPRLQLLRPLWKLPPAAKWIEADDLADAARDLPRFARRVFLTTGVRGLGAFSGLDDIWFLVRLMDPPAEPPPLARLELIIGKPPFKFEDERAILTDHDIDTLVTKHSGGDATAAKVFAAAEAGVKIVLIRRPPPEPGPVAETVDDAFQWIEDRL